MWREMVKRRVRCLTASTVRQGPLFVANGHHQMAHTWALSTVVRVKSRWSRTEVSRPRVFDRRRPTLPIDYFMPSLSGSGRDSDGHNKGR